MFNQEALLAIPVYNEANHIGEVLRESRRFIDDILVVDDGSTDQTSRILSETEGIQIRRHPTNLGYGQSLADAFQFAGDAGYRWLITMDCDWQHEPSFIPVFVEAARANDADIISGSRYLRGFDDNSLPPIERRAINHNITQWLNDRLGLGITDAFCGFKAYRVAALRRIHVTVTGYAMPLQVWVQAWRAGLRIREVPIRLIYNDPNRHFGGDLDNPERRMRHYLEVLNAELAATADRARRLERARHCIPRDPCVGRAC